MDDIVRFMLELERLKSVTRKTRVTGSERFENSAEHSWQIAMFAAALAPFAPTSPPGFDLARVTAMLLVHDVGEIDTGDTLVYIEEGEAERKAAERAAVERIFGLLPVEQAAPFVALWQEFEDGTTPEARFAHAADRAMPALLNLANRGQSWVEHGITHERVVRRIGPPIEAGCPALWAWMRARLDEELARGWFGTLPPANEAPPGVG
ncbi:MAG: HD domain-containing protein [Rubrivivax sp.]|nr:HD domain-containing protein [Rubrivivax sp.]